MEVNLEVPANSRRVEKRKTNIPDYNPEEVPGRERRSLHWAYSSYGDKKERKQNIHDLPNIGKTKT